MNDRVTGGRTALMAEIERLKRDHIGAHRVSMATIRHVESLLAAQEAVNRQLRVALDGLFPKPEPRADGLGTTDHSVDENLEAAIIDIEGGRADQVVAKTLHRILQQLVMARKVAGVGKPVQSGVPQMDVKELIRRVEAGDLDSVRGFGVDIRKDVDDSEGAP